MVEHLLSISKAQIRFPVLRRCPGLRQPSSQQQTGPPSGRKETGKWGENKGGGAWGPGADPWVTSRSSRHPGKHNHLWPIQSLIQAWTFPGTGCTLTKGTGPWGSGNGTDSVRTYSVDSALPATMLAAHTIVPSTLTGHGWGRSGSCQFWKR